MDDKEYLSIKYRIHLKKDETSMLSSSLSTSSSEQRHHSIQTNSTFRKRDQDAQAALFKGTIISPVSSSPMSASPSVSSTTKTTTYSYNQSVAKSPSEVDSCGYCSNILTRTAEFLTKLELRYGITAGTVVPSSITSCRGAKKEAELSIHDAKYFARRRKSHEFAAQFDNKAIIPPTSTAPSIKRRSESSKSARDASANEESTFQKVSSSEIATPLNWMSAASPNPSKEVKEKVRKPEKKPDEKKEAQQTKKKEKPSTDMKGSKENTIPKFPEELKKPATTIIHMTIKEKAGPEKKADSAVKAPTGDAVKNIDSKKANQAKK